VFSGGPVWALTARWGEPRGETERRDYPEEEIGKILRGNLQGILRWGVATVICLCPIWEYRFRFT
jgi:hypothetical protein